MDNRRGAEPLEPTHINVAIQTLEQRIAALLPGRLCAISTSGAGGLEASDNWEMGDEHLAAAAYGVVAADYESRFVDELRTKPRDCELLDELAARATGPVLDIGSGPGHIGARVRSAGRHVVAFDLSGAMAAAARRRVGSAVIADMIHLPIATASVADIVAFNSVIHLSRTQLHHAMVEFSRVLIPEGTVLLSAHEGDSDVAVTEFLGHDVHAAIMGGIYMAVLHCYAQTPVVDADEIANTIVNQALHGLHRQHTPKQAAD